MSIRQGFLALLTERPMNGYQLRQESEARTGGTWPLNIGQVYTKRPHRSRLAWIGFVVALLAMAAILWLLIAILPWAEGTAVPPISAALTAPDVSVINSEKICGSGGCSQMLTIRNDTKLSAEAWISSRGVAVEERFGKRFVRQCYRPQLLLLRRACTEIWARNGELVGYLNWEPLFRWQRMFGS